MPYYRSFPASDRFPVKFLEVFWCHSTLKRYVWIDAQHTHIHTHTYRADDGSPRQLGKPRQEVSSDASRRDTQRGIPVKWPSLEKTASCTKSHLDLRKRKYIEPFYSTHISMYVLTHWKKKERHSFLVRQVKKKINTSNDFATNYGGLNPNKHNMYYRTLAISHQGLTEPLTLNITNLGVLAPTQSSSVKCLWSTTAAAAAAAAAAAGRHSPLLVPATHHLLSSASLQHQWLPLFEERCTPHWWHACKSSWQMKEVCLCYEQPQSLSPR